MITRAGARPRPPEPLAILLLLLLLHPCASTGSALHAGHAGWRAEMDGGGCAAADQQQREAVPNMHLVEDGTTALVPFSNANPYTDAFRQPERHLLIGGKSVRIKQSWEERSETDLEPTGMKWTGAAVWDAAIVLSEFLAQNDHLVKGKRVLEVGAGLATLAVTCGVLGAREAVATDYDELVLQLARANLEANVPEMVQKGAARAEPLMWGSREGADAVKPPYNVVVGSDVVYREDVFKPLIETLEMITNDDSLVILAHKPRGLGEDKFFHWLKRKFIVLRKHSPEELHKDFVNSGVIVHMLRKKRAFDE